MFVLDSHCDTPSQIHRLRDICKDNDHAHVDLPKLKRGGVDAAFFALYTPASLSGDAATSYAFQLLSELYDAVEGSAGAASFALSPQEALECRENGRFAVCIGMENGSPVGDSLSLLRQFWRMGVRYMTLCHSSDNLICDSCAQGNTWHGISPFGKKVIAEMNRMGMMIDLSHASDESFYDAIRLSESPVVATHSCCRALADHPRNMTDEMLKALAENGGVVQINFYPVFLDSGFASVFAESDIAREADMAEEAFISDPSDPAIRSAWYRAMDRLAGLHRPSYRRIADHIDHAVSVAGIDHVGLGSDFDGISVTPEGMEDAGKFSIIFDELRSRGYTEKDIEKIAGGNFLRVWRRVLGQR